MSKRHKLFWGSSYDRGIQYLLFMWPDIKKKFPDAELHVCYGWDLFDKANHTNPERMQWKADIQRLMNQDGIFHYGRVGKDDLKEIRSSCGIWAYPTDFTEINCITALDAQKDGLVPVTMALAALNETVGSGVKLDGDIREKEIQEKYLEELLDIMGDRTKWRSESKKAQKFAKGYEWDKIAKKWTQEFDKPISKPKVSVITVSIREGWWNIMAENMANQTYTGDIEWIIVDDYEKDRQKTADKYAKKYNLDIKYIRGDKVLGKYDRPYGLVRANNKGWENASGELTVWLQDFIIIPEHGIEWLVDIYRHNPDALIAPTDIYYHCKDVNRDNKEDWWDGDTDIITKESWRNIRNEFKGIRETENPIDFEMNYGAIPTSALQELNGWWEFFDEGLGFDNTEIALRAMKLGYRVLIDDTNVAKCIDLWPIIAGEKQNVEGRERALTMPQFVMFQDMMKEKTFPTVRDEKLDDTIKFTFEVPKGVDDDKASEWIRQNSVEIAKFWTADIQNKERMESHWVGRNKQDKKQSTKKSKDSKGKAKGKKKAKHSAKKRGKR